MCQVDRKVTEEKENILGTILHINTGAAILCRLA